jgi:hypothetical protein
MGWPKGKPRNTQGAAETSPLSISTEQKGPVMAEAAQTIKVMVLRDFWKEPNADGTENRVRAGEVIEVSIDAAFEGVEAGMFERYKGE